MEESERTAGGRILTYILSCEEFKAATEVHAQIMPRVGETVNLLNGGHNPLPNGQYNVVRVEYPLAVLQERDKFVVSFPPAVYVQPKKLKLTFLQKIGAHPVNS